MTNGSTVVAGVRVSCRMIGLKDMRIGPRSIARVYSVLLPATGQVFDVDNFEPENPGALPQ